MQDSITSARAFIEDSISKQGLTIEDVMLEHPAVLSFRFLWQQIKNKANLKEFSHPLLSEAYQCNEVIFLESRMSSPMIAIQLETLAALGIKKVIYIGIAGSISPNLRIGDIVVSKGAINETGTGICYGHDFKSVIWGDPELSNQVHALLKQEHLNPHQSIHWSTDAPYRESLEKVREFREMGAICVEMEGGGFFAVSRRYQMQATAVFVISDELHGSEWLQGWNNPSYKSTMAVLTDSIIKISDRL